MPSGLPLEDKPVRKLTLMRAQMQAVVRNLGLIGFQSKDNKQKKKISDAISTLEAEIASLKDQEPDGTDADKMTLQEALDIISPCAAKLKTIKEDFQIK